MSEVHHKTLRLRQLAGEINRAEAVYVSVVFSSDEENGQMWIEIPKTNAKEIIAHCTEHGIEEVEGITINEGCLYIDGPGEPAEGEEAASEEEPS